MSEKKINFEEAVENLEKIVKLLESGGLSLEESLEKFEEGVKLIKFCNKELNDAEKKIEIVLKEGDEFNDPIPFNGNEKEN